jgi:hypothetical protein
MLYSPPFKTVSELPGIEVVATPQPLSSVLRCLTTKQTRVVNVRYVRNAYRVEVPYGVGSFLPPLSVYTFACCHTEGAQESESCHPTSLPILHLIQVS